MAGIDGFVYLSIDYNGHTKCFLSLCLKTEKVNKLFDHRVDCAVHPYIMEWPPSLVGNKVRSPCFNMLVKFLQTFGPCIV